jgi:hypothetical protein
MTSWRAFTFAFLGFVAFLQSGGVLSAHHGRAGYGDKVVTMKGVVTEVRWKNPHVFVVFDVKDDNGSVVQWLGELSSTNTMLAAGMNRTSLKPGDEIVVGLRPAQGGIALGLVATIMRADGTVVVRDNYRSETR